MSADKNKSPEDVANEILKGINVPNENEAPVNDELEMNEEDAEFDPMAALNVENQNLSNEIDGLKDRLLRSIAEMENLRKRTEREVSEARNFAIANFARDMLGATDNLSRALQVVPDEERKNGTATLKSLIDGIEMTEREMQRLLQKNGIKPILAMGEKFDPHIHQAMFEVPNTGKPDGTIVEVVQKGFAIGNRILRPAMVGVAKNMGKPAFMEDGENKQNTSNNEHIDKEA